MGLTVSLRRLGYRLAFRALQLHWVLLRPRVEGVKCVITDGDRILLVRHTYGDRSWDLPGGRTRRGELPAATARREMDEELGLDGLTWRPLGALSGRMYRRHDTIHLLAADADAPVLRIDPGELEVATWCDRTHLPEPRTRILDSLLAARVL